jgi:ribose/xylose/arabinose/galactoside ABC-type transport system permease subunit
VKLLDVAKLMLHEAILAIVLLTLIGLAAWIDPAFIALPTQLELSTHAFDLAILSLAMTAVIITGGIDLSIGSIMSSACSIKPTCPSGSPPFSASPRAPRRVP